MSRPQKDWYDYFRNKTLGETSLFENPKNIDYGKEYDRLFKIVKRTYGSLDLGFKLEKLTYDIVTGKKQRVTGKGNKAFEIKYTNQRLHNMAQKYETVKSLLFFYNQGWITLDELNDSINEFKENDKYGYLKNYGK